jgi:uncharacterized membrane protein
MGGIVLALVAVGFLVFFIHHLASSIEPSSILQRVASGTDAAVEGLFPEDLGQASEEEAQDAAASRIRAWAPVPAAQAGYIVSLDNAALLAFAREQDRVVRMELAVGDYAVQGQPLAWLEGAAEPGAKTRAVLNACYSFDRQRTIEQDAAFGLQQMVDVALRALSPGVNDQSTAVLCIDQLTSVLARLARRRIETPYRRDGEALRVIAVGPSFAGLVRLAFADLRESGAGKPAVLDRLLWSLEQIAAATASGPRREALAEELEQVAACAERTLPAARERAQVLARAAQLRSVLP